MKSALTFGIAMPQIVECVAPWPQRVASFAEQAESLGYAALWVNELMTAPVLDPLHLLTFAAAKTSTLDLGVAVLLGPLRIPLQLARDTATMDQLSNGRLIVGLGLGSNPDLCRRYGMSVHDRVRRYEQGIIALKQLWEGGRAAESDFWDLSDAEGILALQRPRPRLWLGARRDAALRRAAELGDGWIVSGSAPAHEFAQALSEIQRHLAELKRDTDDFSIAKRVYLAVSDEPEHDRRRMAEWFGKYYSNPELGHTAALVGPAAHLVSRLADLANRGVDHVILNPVYEEQTQMEWLAQEVLSHLD